ncbi:MAG TPA: YetF domain-containing protein [Acidobacteriaceae bacterium]|nr:YetF domain-containing protein [Acidobacteriaceae bacterium]
MHDLLSSMFHLPLPIAEKILRPVIVYLFLVLCLRLFGKRELAQLNPFDLVVLLTLSNAVQNAIIGDDNSVTGGVIGAFSLLAINWIVVRALFRLPKVNKALEGSETVLVRRGKVDKTALERETLTEMELLSAIHKQGLGGFSEVEKCVLEPNGTFYIEAVQPRPDEAQVAALQKSIELLTTEVKAMRAQLAAQ